MISVDQDKNERINQGDIYKDVEFIQKIEIVNDDDAVIHKILFPLVIVLTQDCDLQQGSAYYLERDKKPYDDDKRLISVIVAPLYNEGLFLDGEHLADETLGMKMRVINKISKKKKLTTDYKNLIENEIPRYHHLTFQAEVPIPPSVIDFKHYFTVCIENLLERQFVCRISKLYREDISHRFASFLSRIGLPNDTRNDQ